MALGREKTLGPFELRQFRFGAGVGRAAITATRGARSERTRAVERAQRAGKFAGFAHAIWPSWHDCRKSLKTEIGPREDAPASHRSASA